MRFAIFSDIHSNLEALEAVIADARERRCTDFVCLGDVVGYNANPGECIQLVRELDCPVVKGNHDEQATFTESSERFNELAERAIEWTRERLNEQDREWLGGLPLQQRVHDFTIVHATLDTPGQWGYVFNNLDAVASFTYQRTSVCFFGHTHVPVAFVFDSMTKGGTYSKFKVERGKKYFVNVGAIGQPRDNNPKAAYVVYDMDESTIELRRLEYDIATAQKKILDAGLPPRLAERLAFGK